MEKDGTTLDPDRGADAPRGLCGATASTRFDMADHYGSAEIIAGRLLSAPRWSGRPVAFTKWCPEPGPMTRDIVRRGVQERLDRLGVACSRPPAVPLVELRASRLARRAARDEGACSEEGLIGAIGVTNFDAAHLALALADGIPHRHQPGLLLAGRPPRRGRPLEPCARRTGVRLLAYGTLCGGFLSERWLGKPEPA